MPKNSLYNPRTWMLVICGSLTVAALVVVGLAGSDHPVPVTLGLLGAFLLALGIAYTVRAIADHTVAEATIFGDTALRDVDMSQLDELADASGPRFLDYVQLFSFIDPILYPESVFSRISETVEGYHRSTLVRSTFSVSLNANPLVDEAPADEPPSPHAVGASSMNIVLPLIVPIKGELLDGLRAFDDLGNRISTVDSYSQLLVSLAAVRCLVWLSGSRAYAAYAKNLEPDFIAAMRSGAAIDSPSRAAMTERFSALPARKDAARVLSSAVSLADALLRLNPVCITVPLATVKTLAWPATVRATIERRYVPRVEDAPGAVTADPLGTWLDGVRLALGVKLHRTFFPLVNAVRTHSYHATLIGPEGTYLAAQAIVPGEPGSSVIANAKFQSRRGQRRSHLHVRSLEAPRGAFLAAHFFERAPGSFLLSTTIAFATALVLSILGHREIAGIGRGAVNLNMLPILLAVPVGVAALSGFESSRWLRHPSLLSRLTTLYSIALSLWGLLLVALRSGDGATDAKQWMVLIALSWGGLAVSAFSWIVRIRVEQYFVSQQEEQ